jgi:hypothetical protein
MGFHQEISKQAKFVPLVGGGGGKGRLGLWTSLLQRAQNLQHGRTEERSMAPGLVSRHQRMEERFQLPGMVPKGSGTWLSSSQGELSHCFSTDNLLGVNILRSLREGVGALTLVIQLELQRSAASPPQP